MIFDGVVSASREHLSHLSPLVTLSSVCQKEDPLFVRHPLHLKDTRIEVVMPAFSTLFAESALDKLSNKGPTLRPILLNQFPDQVIFLFCPRLLLQES